jgi:N-methylhydantoinase B
MAAPVFRQGKLVAFAGCIAHAPDMGGRLRSADSTEIYEEGLQIPPLKVMQQGKLNEDLMTLVRKNVREPELVMGDFRAMISSNEMMARRLLDIVKQQGITDVEDLARVIQSSSEKAMRRAIREIPDGVYKQEVYLDGFDEPLRICLSLEVKGDRIKVDYTGTSPQVNRGLNTVLNYTYAYTAYPIKCAVCPSVPNNEGCFRPIEVTAPEGSLLNPRYPAAVGGRAMVGHFLPTAIFGALADVIPERIQADSGSPLWGVNVSGMHKGKKFAGLFFLNGGQGASTHKDGISCLSYPSNISNTPIEVLENSIPVLVTRKRFLPDSGGPGKWRGGLGQEMEIKITADSPCTLAFLSERIKFPARGMRGGKPGRPGLMQLNNKWIHPKTNVRVQPGDVLTLNTPGGGGFWDPRERDRELVKKDLLNGLVSGEKLREEYGIDPDSL